MSRLSITARARRAGLKAGAATLLAVSAAAACSDFLATDPRGELTTPSFFQTSDHALQATNASYSMLRNWTTHVFSWLGQVEIASDDADKGSVPGDAGFLGELDNLTFDAGNLAFRDPWLGYYQGIYRANVAIQNIPNVNMDEELRARLVGENKFLRAYYYFHLVRAYGGVPLITEPLEAGQFAQTRATAEEVYAQIEQDLTDAIAVLPLRSEYAPADLGRATKGAAQALLGKVHLYQQEYAEAYDQLTAVIESNQYSLAPSYAGIFTQAGENGPESIFEVQVANIEGGNNGPSGAASQYAEVQGVRAPPNIGWGFNTPSAALEASYEPGDPRLEVTVLYPWEALRDAPDLVVYRNAAMPNNRYNQKVSVPPGIPGGTGNSGVNIRRIRYADVLLMAAEAAYRSATEAEARAWVNEVRERARDGHTQTLGFTEEALAEPIADVLGYAGSSRVFARFVQEGTPAYTAGLRSFSDVCGDEGGVCPNSDTPPVRVLNIDIIESVNGTAITDVESLRDAVDGAGATALVSVRRMVQDAAGATTSTVQAFNVPVQALLPDVTASGDALLTAIWNERRAELAMEQHRMFDLRRMNLERAGWAATMFAAHGKVWQDRHQLYPIPASEVAVAGLTQNPGY